GVAAATFDIDRTPPVVNVFDVTDRELVAADVTPVVAVADAHPGTTDITLNGAPFVSGTTVTADGDYELRVHAVDAAGNAADDAIVHFTIDRTPPDVIVDGVTDGEVSPQAVAPAFRAADPHLGSVSATLDGAAFVSGALVAADGAHTLVV